MFYLSSSCKGDDTLWKWVTRGRLFNIGSSLCLGITTGNMSTFGDKSPLGVFRCDYEPPRVRWTWSCSKFLEILDNYLPSSKLLLNTSNVSAADSTPARSPSQKSLWRVYDKKDLCAKPYRGQHIQVSFSLSHSYTISVICLFTLKAMTSSQHLFDLMYITFQKFGVGKILFCCLIFLWKAWCIYFRIPWWLESSKEQHLFKIEINLMSLCWINAYISF